ncbi:hypothetical protein [Melittangium boletus]|uniref:hypothetical protein n=1 Tax=Melittangium boletus TaxID=83453 RepID=UPI001FE5CC56|nr:hypothetical protein [Melittangium boletus]
MNDNDTSHPATRLPQYGFRLSNGSTLGGQPYYAYSTDSVGGFIAAGTGVGTLTIKNTSTGAQSTCTPSQGHKWIKPNPAPGTNARDVPSLWAGPLSPYFDSRG